MSDPRRLIHDGDDFERELLGSAADDAPDEAALRRIARGVGAGAGAAALLGGKAAAAGGALTTAKWIGGALLAASLLGGAGVAVVRYTRPKPAPPVLAAPMIAAPPPVAVEAPAPPVAVEAPAPPEVATPATPEPAAAVAPEPKAAPKRHPASLQLELALIDGARHALDAGDPRRALVELDTYARRFRRGTLAPETDMLRIECLTRLGQRARAATLARRFLAAHPKSPLADRVRSLTDGN